MMAWFFVFFFLSGFCSLVYQVVWLRLAMAAFGVTTPFVSIVLSVFMTGLAVGSWSVGRIGRRLEQAEPRWPLRLYALAEAGIGVSALIVPSELAWGRSILAAGSGVAWDSATYYLASGAWVALALLPFCAAMGATFPLAMAAIRREGLAGSERSFSFLYLANVLGASSGTVLSAFFLVEIFGFAATLLVTALINLLLAGAAMYRSGLASVARTPAAPPVGRASRSQPPTITVALLFLTGLTSMAFEVVWMRQFTPYLGTLVYAFAAILGVYLIANFAGSALYRIRTSVGHIDRSARGFVLTWAIVGCLALVPLLTADPRLSLNGVVRLVLGIVPFCVAIGFLTPMLVDWWSAGDPDRAGRAYAANVIGCILGPLLAGFWLLPASGERGTLVALSLPLFAVGLVAVVKPARLLAGSSAGSTWAALLVFGVSTAAALALLFATRGFESQFVMSHVRRDHTATTIAAGQGRGKVLLVNGIGITKVTPITKMMGHLPILALGRPPRDALVLCLGMGTSFRSMLSWGIPVTAVELVPSVPTLLPFFHADMRPVAISPRARIVVDDGRRFLERSGEQYDVITVDPPPPIMAAGSSLLYSQEFYRVVKRRLRPDGILQQWVPWVPGDDPLVFGSINRALQESFPHVRVFVGLEGWGSHFLASMSPIDLAAPAVLAARMPATAVADMLEWGPATAAEAQLREVLAREVRNAVVEAMAAGAPPLSDDRPYNEYFFLRHHLSWVMTPLELVLNRF